MFLNGEFGGLRILYQTDNARQHRGGTDTRCFDVQCPILIDGARNHTIPNGSNNGHRFTRYHGLINITFARDHRTINWDFFTRLNAHNGAFLDLINRGFGKPILGFDPRRLGLKPDQAFNRGTCLSFGTTFHKPPK